MINGNDFYREYRGHRTRDLDYLIKFFRKTQKPLIFLAGDSSLDNKYWIRSKISDAVNGYEMILDPPKMVEDVSYHLNAQSVKHNLPYVALNCAIEESTLSGRLVTASQNSFRTINGLLPQDEIIMKKHYC